MPHSNVCIIRRALVSVSDKSHISEFARFLVDQGVEILATGGTAELLKEQGVSLTDVSDYTACPEIMRGRVKTLHPKIHGGLLGEEPLDNEVMRKQGIKPIDLLVVNLYPFEETATSAPTAAPADIEKCIENIDVGGPAMIRAAAKNHARVAVVVRPDDYSLAQKSIEAQGGIPLDLRRQFAARAFRMTAQYDRAISEWFEQIVGSGVGSGAWRETRRELRSEPFDNLADRLTLTLDKTAALRYGENPHQRAALYRANSQSEANDILPGVSQLMGKPLSFNNIADASVAAGCAAEFERPTCVIVKHAVPCGVACATDITLAWKRALEADPISAFGGIIALNRRLNKTLAQAVVDSQFVELIVAPEVETEALAILGQKPSMRVLQGRLSDGNMDIRSVAGRYLIQDCDRGRIAESDLAVKTKRKPTEQEISDLLFAWRVVKYVKSNAIVFASDGCVTGIGAGQTSRVDSVRIAAQRTSLKMALKKAAKTVPQTVSKANVVMASDAFFPFEDSLAIAHEHQVKAIIQPGGSKNDAAVIKAADDCDMAMVFTGMRHFRH